MTRPWTWWLAVALCALSGVLLVGVLLFSLINRDAPDVWRITDSPYSFVGAVAYSLVGVLLATRRPGNALGWLFLVVGVMQFSSILASHWGIYGLETRPGAPGAALALWGGLGLGAALPITLPLLLFPSGRLPDRWTRLIAVLSVAANAALVVFLMSGNFAPPGFPVIYDRTPNPLARSEPLGDPALMIIALGIFGLIAIGLLLARFRSSHGVARQQYKWVVLDMAFIAAAFVADFFARASGSQAFHITSPVQSLAVDLLPVAMGVAILRYHLFDIDHVFNRTLVYGMLSASLLGAYLLGVVLFQRLLGPIVHTSDLAVAGTTLLVAALFHPLRSRIQQAVDRRFNRERYDAARMIETFSGRLRNEVDLDAIGAELQSVVVQTMQPTHVSLWLRPPSGNQRM